MSTYGWRITADHLSDDDNAVGTTGPRDIPTHLEARLDAGEGETFRLYDDDGILYYTGRIVAETDEDLYAETDAPLRDFGEGYAGCTAVRYPKHPDWDCS